MIEFDRQMKEDIWMVEDDESEDDENESEKLFYDDLCETFLP